MKAKVVLSLFTFFCMLSSLVEGSDKSGGHLETIILAGGCFWCMEAPFDKIEGVKDTVVGYSGGEVVTPSYEEICRGNTGHFEVVKVTFDPSQLELKELLNIFFYNINATDEGGQFADRGEQYKTAIIYFNSQQKETAMEAIRQFAYEQGMPVKNIKTMILPFKNFYLAEEHHQDYYKKCPLPYSRYKKGSGREAFIKRLEKIKKKK